MEQSNIRADQILDRVEDCRMVNDLINPCKQKMRLEVMALGELDALRRFEILHGFAVAPRLLGAKGVDRIDEPVALILVDLRGGQLPAHVTILYCDPAAVDEQQAAGAAPLNDDEICCGARVSCWHIASVRECRLSDHC